MFIVNPAQKKYEKTPVFRTPSTQTVIALFTLFLLTQGVDAGAKKKVPPFQPLMICTQRGHVAHVLQNKTDWEYDGDGEAREIQPQPAGGRVLVIGGSRQVYLLRKVDSGLRVIWDWSNLDGVSIVSAVAADWDLKGEPSLILGADTLGKRLILAEAKSTGVKIRWQYPLADMPLKVRLCPDSGNFLVLLDNGSIEEIQYQEDKLVWEWDSSQGASRLLDALRGSQGDTFGVQADGTVLCVKPDKTIAWKSILPFQAAGRKLVQSSLSLFKKYGRHWLMVSAHDLKGPGATDILYVLDPESGKVAAISDHLGKEAYPPLISAVPEELSNGRKE
jgi:hypothetical protein